jgi:hypothetical protein
MGFQRYGTMIGYLYFVDGIFRPSLKKEHLTECLEIIEPCKQFLDKAIKFLSRSLGLKTEDEEILKGPKLEYSCCLPPFAID